MTKFAEALPKSSPAGASAASPPPITCCPKSGVPDFSCGLRRRESKAVVARLCVMFALDAFAGAFVLQTWIAFWFDTTWQVLLLLSCDCLCRVCAASAPYALRQLSPSLIGYLIMCANVVAGLSAVAAAYFVNKFGAMNTMLFSHFPSNILLLLVPFMPSPLSAAAMLVARFTMSQMDVPARNTCV